MNEEQNSGAASDEAEAGPRPWRTTLILFVIVGLALLALEYLLNWVLPVR